MAIIPAVSVHPGKHTRHSYAKRLIDLSGHRVFPGCAGTSGMMARCKMWSKKRGGSAFKDQRWASKRHRYFNDREKLLKRKDFRIFVTEKSYFFFWLPRTFLFCVIVYILAAFTWSSNMFKICQKYILDRKVRKWQNLPY